MASHEGFFWIGQSYDVYHHVMTFSNTGLTRRWKFGFLVPIQQKSIAFWMAYLYDRRGFTSHKECIFLGGITKWRNMV